jgi:hypothetical protein
MMAAKIEVTGVREVEFQVVVVEGASRSKHQVMLKDRDYARLSEGKVSPEDLIAKSFEFLLEHEPKESILPRFDLLEIARYFPGFERDVRRKMGKQ